MSESSNSPITISEDKLSTAYENKTSQNVIADTVAQIRKAIADILIAENRLESAELQAKVIEIVSGIKPTISLKAIVTAVLEGFKLGINQAGLYEDMDKPTAKRKDALKIAQGLFDYNKVIQTTSKDALRLAKALPVEEGYVDVILGAVKQVENKANRLSATIAARAQAEGTILAAKANGTKLVWVNELKACLHCLAYAGKVVSPDKPFGIHTYDNKPLDIEALNLESPDGVKGPPLHPHCRCRLRVWDGPDPRDPADIPTKNNTVTFPEALQREARRAVLRGDSNYDSLPTRIKAADKLLALGADLPKTVVKRAEQAVKNKQFPSRN